MAKVNFDCAIKTDYLNFRAAAEVMMATSQEIQNYVGLAG